MRGSTAVALKGSGGFVRSCGESSLKNFTPFVKGVGGWVDGWVVSSLLALETHGLRWELHSVRRTKGRVSHTEKGLYDLQTIVTV